MAPPTEREVIMKELFNEQIDKINKEVGHCVVKLVEPLPRLAIGRDPHPVVFESNTEMRKALEAMFLLVREIKIYILSVKVKRRKKEFS